MTIAIPVWALEAAGAYAIIAVLIIVITKFIVIRDDDPRDMTAFTLGIMWPVVVCYVCYDTWRSVRNWRRNRKDRNG